MRSECHTSLPVTASEKFCSNTASRLEMCSLRGQSTGKPNHKSKFKPSSDEEKHRSSAESEEVTVIDTWGHKLRIRDQRGAREQMVWAHSQAQRETGVESNNLSQLLDTDLRLLKLVIPGMETAQGLLQPMAEQVMVKGVMRIQKDNIKGTANHFIL